MAESDSASSYSSEDDLVAAESNEVQAAVSALEAVAESLFTAAIATAASSATGMATAADSRSSSSSEIGSDESFFNDDAGEPLPRPEEYGHPEEWKPDLVPAWAIHPFGMRLVRSGPEATRPPNRELWRARSGGSTASSSQAASAQAVLHPETHRPADMQLATCPELERHLGTWRCHACQAQNLSHVSWCSQCGVERLC